MIHPTPEKSVIVENVSLDYPLGRRGIDFLGAMLRGNSKHTEDVPDYFTALKGISFDVEKGQRLAIVGSNGAGKTTLLRVISGIYAPTGGAIATNGTVFSLLSPMMGFDREASGLENILLRSLACGVPMDVIEANTDDIIEFSGLKKDINRPLRTYSAGMTIRLAFSISTAYRPDILVMDEWIAGGDKQFMEKARERLEKFVEETGTLFVASHSVDLIRKYCDTGLWLHEGQLKMFGPLEEVLAAMNAAR